MFVWEGERKGRGMEEREGEKGRGRKRKEGTKAYLACFFSSPRAMQFKWQK